MMLSMSVFCESCKASSSSIRRCGDSRHRLDAETGQNLQDRERNGVGGSLAKDRCRAGNYGEHFTGAQFAAPKACDFVFIPLGAFE